MGEATIALTTMTGLLLAIFLGMLVWGIRSGQFKNIEEAKYNIFRTDKEGEKTEVESTDAEKKNGGGDGQ